MRYMKIFRLLFLLFLLPAPLLAAPQADLWERWIPEPQAGASPVDHSALDSLLKRFVSAAPDGVNRVDYGALATQGRRDLQDYIAGLEALRPTEMTEPEAMAFWINLYNAVTLKVVIDHYPVDSILDIDISPGLFSFGPWDAETVAVDGVDLTLNDIEHRILRPIFRDPRIHYAVNCASIGCPNLSRDAYSAVDLDTQLDRAARNFIDHDRALRFGEDGLTVSSIYDWFADDFGGADAAIIAHLAAHAGPERRARLRFYTEIRGDDYDWRLNDIRTAP